MASAPELNSRLPRIASIRASVLWPLVEQIDKRSGKTDLLLAGHGILRSQLDDPYAMIPMARYVAIFEEAAQIAEEQKNIEKLSAENTRLYDELGRQVTNADARALQADLAEFLHRSDPVVDDEVLSTFAVVAPPEEVAATLWQRCAGRIDRVLPGFAAGTDEGLAGEILDDLRNQIRTQER